MTESTKRRSSSGAATKKHSEMEQAVKHFIKHVLDTKMTIPGRVASALNYFAEACPYMVFPYNVLYQAVMGFERQPRIGSEDVVRFRSKMTAAAKILHEKFGRGKHAVPGVGVRATVDSADRLVTEVPRKRIHARAAVNALSKSMASIDIKKVPNTPELKEHKEWYMNNAKNILSDADDLVRRLLPPGKNNGT